MHCIRVNIRVKTQTLRAIRVKTQTLRGECGWFGKTCFGRPTKSAPIHGREQGGESVVNATCLAYYPQGTPGILFGVGAVRTAKK